MPCSTASRIEPFLDKTSSATSFEALPKGQVETTSGSSPFLMLAPCVVAKDAAPSKPTVVPPTNRRLDIPIRTTGMMGSKESKWKRKRFVCGYQDVIARVGPELELARFQGRRPAML